jgi:phage tail-like protein
VTNGKKELKAWFDEAQSGKKRRVRKTITVTLFKSDKTPGRHYLLYDCFPTQWSSVNFDTSSTVQTETLTVKTTRVEFKT